MIENKDLATPDARKTTRQQGFLLENEKSPGKLISRRLIFNRRR